MPKKKSYIVVDIEDNEDLDNFSSLDAAKEFCENRWLDVRYEGEVKYGVDVYSGEDQVAEIEIVDVNSEDSELDVNFI